MSLNYLVSSLKRRRETDVLTARTTPISLGIKVGLAASEVEREMRRIEAGCPVSVSVPRGKSKSALA